MEKNRYEQLTKISIEKSGIIKCDISDPIYKFCMINRIDNLGDFVKVYNEKKNTMDRRHNFYYFDGVIDLINLVFFNDSLLEAKNLRKKIKIFNNKKAITHYAYVERTSINEHMENASLRRLGFNNEETKTILRHVLYLGKEVSIITAIKSCIRNFDFKKMDQGDEMFITKLYVLSEYYDKSKNSLEKVENYDLYKVQEKIKELKKLYRQMFKLQKKIFDLSCDFENQVDKLSEDDEAVKYLIKEYQSFNCKQF